MGDKRRQVEQRGSAQEAPASNHPSPLLRFPSLLLLRRPLPLSLWQMGNAGITSDLLDWGALATAQDYWEVGDAHLPTGGGLCFPCLVLLDCVLARTWEHRRTGTPHCDAVQAQAGWCVVCRRFSFLRRNPAPKLSGEGRRHLRQPKASFRGDGGGYPPVFFRIGWYRARFIYIPLGPSV